VESNKGNTKDTTCSSCGKSVVQIENKFVTEDNTVIVDAVEPQSDDEVFE